jgi:hypothetical protein
MRARELIEDITLFQQACEVESCFRSIRRKTKFEHLFVVERMITEHATEDVTQNLCIIIPRDREIQCLCGRLSIALPKACRECKQRGGVRTHELDAIAGKTIFEIILLHVSVR